MPKHPLILAAAFSALAFVPAVVDAAEFRWGGGSGSWSTGSNWMGGMLPDSAVDTDLYFGSGLSGAYTSNNDLVSPFQLNSLVFDATEAAERFLLGGALEFHQAVIGPGPMVEPPSILQVGSAAVTISNDLVLMHRLTLEGDGPGMVTLDGAISGGIPGMEGNLQPSMRFSGGNWRMTNLTSTYVGGTAVRTGTTLELYAGESQSVSIAQADFSILGNTGNSMVNRLSIGGTLRLTTTGFGAITIGEGRQVVFNAPGGFVEMVNFNPEFPTSHSGNIFGGEFSVLLDNTVGPAVFRFNGGQMGLSHNGDPTSGIWAAGDNALRFSGISASLGVVSLGMRVELSNGAMVRAGIGTSTPVKLPTTIRGEVGGDPTSGFDGTIDSGRSKTTARVAVDRAAETTYTHSLVLEGALQVAAVAKTRALNGNLRVAGTASGAAGYVSFSGLGTNTDLSDALNPPDADSIGQNPLWLLRNGSTPDPTPGVSPGGTLTVETGGTAVFDVHHRTDASGFIGNGVALDGLAVLQAGSELRILQSVSNFSPFEGAIPENIRSTGDTIIFGDIQGEGTTESESVLNVYLPEPRPESTLESTIPATLTATPTSAAQRPYGGLRFDDSRGLADFIVNGSGLGGLAIVASPRPAALFDPTHGTADPVRAIDKITPIATAARLSRLTGTGGYLTVSTPGDTWAFPAGGEWAAGVPVGLKITDHHLAGVDVSLAALSGFAHPIALDQGTLDLGTAPFAFGPAARTPGLGLLSGEGTIIGFMVASGGAEISPGFGAGTLEMGSLTFLEGARFTIELNGQVAGTEYDQAGVADTFTLAGNVALSILLGFDPADFGTPFVLVRNDGLGPVQGSGLFAMGGELLGEGALFVVEHAAGPQTFQITYAGGDGNDVAVRAMPEPGSAALLASAMGFLGLGRFRRNRVA